MLLDGFFIFLNDDFFLLDGLFLLLRDILLVLGNLLDFLFVLGDLLNFGQLFGLGFQEGLLGELKSQPEFFVFVASHINQLRLVQLIAFIDIEEFQVVVRVHHILSHNSILDLA